MAIRPLSFKLGIKEGDTVCVFNPNPVTIEQLKKEESGNRVDYTNILLQGCDVILLWLTPSDDVFALLSHLMEHIKKGGRIWVIIPKKEICKKRGIIMDWGLIQARILDIPALVDNKAASINDEEYGTQYVIRREYRKTP